MEAITGMASGAVYRPDAAGGVKAPPEARRPDEGARGGGAKPAADEYVPEEKREPSGRYWLGSGENGRPRVYFDDPDREAERPERAADAPGPQKSGRNGGACAVNTDRVDREIERLKKRRQELEQRLCAETDETRIEDLERQMAQVERELRAKDNETYRRQHSTFTRLS